MSSQRTIFLLRNIRYSLEYFVDRFKLHEKDFRRDYKVVTEERSAYNRGHYLNPDQRAYIDELIDKGLFEASSRNESMMLLIRHCYERGMDHIETSFWVRMFFRDRHNNKSKDWLANPDRCTQAIEYAVQNWWKKAYPNRRAIKARLQLSPSEYQYVESLELPSRDKEFLLDALLYIANNKRGDIIVLSARQIRRLFNVHSKNEKRKLALLEELGIIELKKEAKPRNRLAREFIVRYQFGTCQTKNNLDGQAIPRKASDRIDALILSGHTNSEIRKSIPTASRQLIFYRRRRLEYIMQRDQLLDD